MLAWQYLLILALHQTMWLRHLQSLHRLSLRLPEQFTLKSWRSQLHLYCVFSRLPGAFKTWQQWPSMSNSFRCRMQLTPMLQVSKSIWISLLCPAVRTFKIWSLGLHTLSTKSKPLHYRCLQQVWSTMIVLLCHHSLNQLEHLLSLPFSGKQKRLRLWPHPMSFL